MKRGLLYPWPTHVVAFYGLLPAFRSHFGTDTFGHWWVLRVFWWEILLRRRILRLQTAKTAFKWRPSFAVAQHHRVFPGPGVPLYSVWWLGQHIGLYNQKE